MSYSFTRRAKQGDGIPVWYTVPLFCSERSDSYCCPYAWIALGSVFLNIMNVSLCFVTFYHEYSQKYLLSQNNRHFLELMAGFEPATY